MRTFYDMCHANRNHLKSKMVKHGMPGQDVHSRHRAATMVSKERNTKIFFFFVYRSNFDKRRIKFLDGYIADITYIRLI